MDRYDQWDIMVTSRWAPGRLKSSATQVFVSLFVLANIIENTKAALLAIWEGNPPVTGGFP